MRGIFVAGCFNTLFGRLSVLLVGFSRNTNEEFLGSDANAFWQKTLVSVLKALYLINVFVRDVWKKPKMLSAKCHRLRLLNFNEFYSCVKSIAYESITFLNFEWSVAAEKVQRCGNEA